MTIHHAVAKKAAKLGVALQATTVDGKPGYSASKGNMVAAASTATDALALLLAELKPTKQPRAKKATKAKGKKRKARKSDDEEDDGEGGSEPKSIVKKKYKVLYRPTKDTNGDDFAEALHACLFPDGEEFDMRAFTATCRANSVADDRIKKWTKLKNNGMRRMNIANTLRGMIRRGEKVTLGAKIFKGSLKALPERKAPKD